MRQFILQLRSIVYKGSVIIQFWPWLSCLDQALFIRPEGLILASYFITSYTCFVFLQTYVTLVLVRLKFRVWHIKAGYLIQNGTGSQWREHSTGWIWSCFPDRATLWAAVFWIHCSLSVKYFRRPEFRRQIIMVIKPWWDKFMD